MSLINDLDRIYYEVLKEEMERVDPEISFEDLVAKVQAAAEQIGITGLVARELDRGLLNSWFKDGLIRESRLDTGSNLKRVEEDLDLGYFVKDSRLGYFTERSFECNSWVFSPEKQSEFYQALSEQGLIPGEDRYTFGLVMNVSREQVERYNQRSRTARYR